MRLNSSIVLAGDTPADPVDISTTLEYKHRLPQETFCSKMVQQNQFALLTRFGGPNPGVQWGTCRRIPDFLTSLTCFRYFGPPHMASGNLFHLVHAQMALVNLL